MALSLGDLLAGGRWAAWSTTASESLASTSSPAASARARRSPHAPSCCVRLGRVPMARCAPSSVHHDSSKNAYSVWRAGRQGLEPPTCGFETAARQLSYALCSVRQASLRMGSSHDSRVPRSVKPEPTTARLSGKTPRSGSGATAHRAGVNPRSVLGVTGVCAAPARFPGPSPPRWRLSPVAHRRVVNDSITTSPVSSGEHITTEVTMSAPSVVDGLDVHGARTVSPSMIGR